MAAVQRRTTDVFQSITIIPPAIPPSIPSASGRARFLAGAANPAYRKFGPADRTDIAAHLARLSDHDRRLRFMGYVSKQVTDRYAASLDWGRSVVIGCVAEHGLRGIVHLACADPLQRKAEIGLSVEAGFRNRKIGTELLRRSLLAARNRSMKLVTINCLAENQAMRRLAERFADEAFDGGGEIRFTLRLDPPDMTSRTAETIADAAALIRRLYDTQKPDFQ